MKNDHKWDYVGLNFKGFANKVRSTDIKLPAPIPLPNNSSESQKNSANKIEIDNFKPSTNSNLKPQNHE